MPPPLIPRKPRARARAHPCLERAGTMSMHDSTAARTLVVALLLATGTTWASDKCDAPAESWRPRSEVHALAERNGWQVERLKVDDGCYEIKGRDAQGRRFKAKLDPATLQVIALKREHDRRKPD